MQQKNMLTTQDIELISSMIKNTVNDSMVSFAGTVSKIIEPLAADIKEIRKDVSGLKIDVAVLKTDVAAIKTDLRFFKEDTLEFKKYVRNDRVEQGSRIMRLEDPKLYFASRDKSSKA
jgi:uncharacterized protein (UPF0335 family)